MIKQGTIVFLAGQAFRSLDQRVDWSVERNSLAARNLQVDGLEGRPTAARAPGSAMRLALRKSSLELRLSAA
jgi:hypothetical protein